MRYVLFLSCVCLFSSVMYASFRYTPSPPMDCIWVDVEGDGDADLIVIPQSGPIILYEATPFGLVPRPLFRSSVTGDDTAPPVLIG